MPFLLNRQQRANHVGLATCIAFGALLVLHCHPVVGQMIYWTDGTNNTIQRATVDGENVVTLISGGLDRPDGIAIDPAAKKMYWTEWGGRIQRADLDGSNLELVVDVGGSPRDVALDLVNEKAYWIHASADGIQRANLDGTNVETVRDSHLFSGQTIAIDVSAGKLYWGGGGSVNRMNLDGTSEEFSVIADNGDIRQIDLDVLNESIYWTNTQFRFIAWDGFDGNGDGQNEILQTGDAEPFDVAIDTVNQVFFWTERTGVGSGSIKRSDFGGVNVVSIIQPTMMQPLGIAIGPPPDIPAAVPTASQWGLAVMVCLLLVTGILILRRRDVRSCEVPRT